MRFEKNVEDRHTVIKLLEEKLDSRISATLKSEFVNLSAIGTRNIILNLDQVRYADSSGLSAILTAKRLCDNAGGMLVVSNLTSHVEKLIKISQLDTVLNILPTESEAREAVFMHEIEREVLSESMVGEEEGEEAENY
ncbi:MAG: STAS domain-containing protein [Bacteroidia bacterium]|nr:STAS domain-containing protein [Bacteroidia bacterium]